MRRQYCDTVSTFQFTAAEPGRFGKGWAALQLKPGDPVKVVLGGEQVINGSIVDWHAAYDAELHELAILGRSLTDATIKPSVVVESGSYVRYTFEQAARGVLAPHGIQLIIKDPPPIVSKPFPRLAIQYGETVHEFIDRIARMRGLFLTDDADGNLVASQLKPGSASIAELEEGRTS